VIDVFFSLPFREGVGFFPFSSVIIPITTPLPLYTFLEGCLLFPTSLFPTLLFSTPIFFTPLFRARGFSRELLYLTEKINHTNRDFSCIFQKKVLSLRIIYKSFTM
jgi:hypothetical protein